MRYRSLARLIGGFVVMAVPRRAARPVSTLPSSMRSLSPRSLAVLGVIPLVVVAIASCCGTTQSSTADAGFGTYVDGGKARGTAEAGKRDGGGTGCIVGPTRPCYDGGKRDAGRDAGEGRDARPDSPSPLDGTLDADAIPHGCTFTGEARGTVTMLATAATGTTIEDFDIDCQTLFHIDSKGGVASCPAVAGCGAAATTIAAEGTYPVAGPSSIRIGASGLFVLNPLSTPFLAQDATTSFDPELFALARDGTWSSFEALFPSSDYGSSASLLQGTPGFLSFFMTNDLPPGAPIGPATPLWVVQPTLCGDGGVHPNGCFMLPGDGGVFTVVSFPGNYGGRPDAGPSTATVSSTGTASYQTVRPLTGPASILRYDLTSTNTTGTPYWTTTPPARPENVVSSDAFVVWTEARADAGPAVTYVCPAAAPCTTPTIVTGLGAYTQLAASDDALFLTDPAGDLASCPASLLLVGACVPSMLHAALTIRRFQADENNAYVLPADGSHVMRIAL